MAASSSRSCAINKCQISSCAVCHCCQKDLCLDHLKEHRDLLNTELTPLANQINSLLDELEHFTPTSLPSFQLLEQWRSAAHETVDRFYERMRVELLEQRKNTPLEKLHRIRNNLDQLIRRQGATRENINSLANDIQSIGQEIDGLRHIQIQLNPLVIDEKTIIQSQQRSVEPNNRRNENVFQIFIQLQTGKTILIMIKPTDTIMDIKRKIQEREGIAIETQRLAYMGKVLQDEYPISMYDFHNLSTINLILVLRQTDEQKKK